MKKDSITQEEFDLAVSDIMENLPTKLIFESNFHAIRYGSTTVYSIRPFTFPFMRARHLHSMYKMDQWLIYLKWLTLRNRFATPTIELTDHKLSTTSDALSYHIDKWKLKTKSLAIVKSVIINKQNFRSCRVLY